MSGATANALWPTIIGAEPFLTFDIRVVPPSKKNSQKIVVFGGHAALVASETYRRATKLAVPQIVEQFEKQADPMTVAYTGLVRMQCIFHVLYKSTDKNSPDLPNLLHAPADWLQPEQRDDEGKVRSLGASVIENDRQIRSVDGSRVVYECDGCPDKKSGCNWRFETRLKKNGEPRVRRSGKLMRDKVQVCQRARIEIALFGIEE